MNYTKLSLFIIIFCFINCSSLGLRNYDNFWEWFKGKPGYSRAIDSRITYMSGEPRRGIVGERHPLYLWFRTPEILFNPQGGIYYPDMIIVMRGSKLYNTADISKVESQEEREKIIQKRNDTFTVMDSGIVDYVLQYRSITDPYSGIKETLRNYAVFPIVVITLSIRAIVYPIHDVIKTITLPFAVLYYTVEYYKSDEEEE